MTAHLKIHIRTAESFHHLSLIQEKCFAMHLRYHLMTGAYNEKSISSENYEGKNMNFHPKRTAHNPHNSLTA